MLEIGGELEKRKEKREAASKQLAIATDAGKHSSLSFISFHSLFLCIMTFIVDRWYCSNGQVES